MTGAEWLRCRVCRRWFGRHVMVPGVGDGITDNTPIYRHNDKVRRDRVLKTGWYS